MFLNSQTLHTKYKTSSQKARYFDFLRNHQI
jgi:hypothetical protein